MKTLTTILWIRTNHVNAYIRNVTITLQGQTQCKRLHHTLNTLQRLSQQRCKHLHHMLHIYYNVTIAWHYRHYTYYAIMLQTLTHQQWKRLQNIYLFQYLLYKTQKKYSTKKYSTKNTAQQKTCYKPWHDRIVNAYIIKY